MIAVRPFLYACYNTQKSIKDKFIINTPLKSFLWFCPAIAIADIQTKYTVRMHKKQITKMRIEINLLPKFLGHEIKGNKDVHRLDDMKNWLENMDLN